jgi:hypothetical protein
VGAGLVAAAIVILLFFSLSSTSRPSAPEEPPSPTPSAAPPKPVPKPAPVQSPPPNPEKAAAAIKELEALAGSSAAPIAVLQRCDEIRPLIAGTSHEARLKAIEDRAREDRRIQQLDASLEEVKKLRALDPGYERKEEIVRLLNATLALSGSRRPEVEETIRSYQRDAQAYVPPAPLPEAKAAVPLHPGAALSPAPAAVAGPLGAYDTDAAGCVNHWLVLGPFGNRNHRDGLYDHDLLHPEASHIPSPGLEVATRESTRVRWTPVVATDGKLDFAQALGPDAKTGNPMIAFAACWVVAENDLEAKLRIYVDLGFMLYLDGQKIRNQTGGHRFNEEEDIYRVKLSRGPHLLMFKIATTSGAPYLRLKLTQNSPNRMTGLKIWSQAPESRRLLYAESFNDGTGGFTNGILSAEGVNGTKALLVQGAAWKEGVLRGPITADMVMRFKVKPLTDAKSFQVLMWSKKTQQNFWYHVYNLKKGEWNAVEFKLAALRGGYKMEGPSAEGDELANLRFHIEASNGVEGRALVDDLEILE